MDIKTHIRTAIALGTTACALAAGGCAKQQVSCAHFAHEHGVPGAVRHAVLSEARAKGGNCVVSQPK